MSFKLWVIVVAALGVASTACTRSGSAEKVAQGGQEIAQSDSSREEIAAVLRTLAAVYDTALILEELKAEQGAPPRVTTPAELSNARFGSDTLTEMLKDGWDTPLHVESDPAGGYVVAAAGSDRQFDRQSWSSPAATRSPADDIVLRDGKLVRMTGTTVMSRVTMSERLFAAAPSFTRKLTVRVKALGVSLGFEYFTARIAVW